MIWQKFVHVQKIGQGFFWYLLFMVIDSSDAEPMGTEDQQAACSRDIMSPGFRFV